MKLFNDQQQTQILPFDGIARYYGQVFNQTEADHYFQTLMNNIAWRNDEAIMFGKKIITKRKVAWYGDKNYDYTYSNTTRQALAWTTDLLELKTIAERLTECSFNSCLLNLYHSGDEGVAWHSDDEITLAPAAGIASISFGADRKFSFRHKKNSESRSIILEHGSLLLMAGSIQEYWLHSLPKTKKVKLPRISLTFRKMIV